MTRRLFVALGGFEETFNQYRGAYEDQAFLAKLYLSTNAYIANNTWDRYRLHPDSCCAVTAKTGELDLARKVYLDWLAERLRQHSISDQRIWAAWRWATLRYRHPLLFKFIALGSSLRRRLRKVSANFTFGW
jgi:hypothetical protein